MVGNPRLRRYVQERLAGRVITEHGVPVTGPTVPFTGRNRARRADRRWAQAWSPQQIAARLRRDFPDDPTMRISHEAIYHALYIEGRGALSREYVACLRTGRALRVPRARTRRARRNQRGFITPEVTLDRRPAEVDDREVPGHWEGDLIIGLNRSAIGTLVERATRYTILLPLPRMEGYGIQDRVKNGPALAGRGADAVKNALISAVKFLPEKLRTNSHLGPWHRDGSARRHHPPDRTVSLLLRPSQPLATRNEREHQRPTPPVLSQRHGSVPIQPRATCRGRAHP